MRYILALSLAGLVCARPSSGSLEDSLQKRQTPLYEAPDGLKNTKVYISDLKVNWGTINPVDVIKRLQDECDTSGCNTTYEDTTQIFVKGNADGGPLNWKVTINTNSDYDGWAKSGLADIHRIFMEHITADEGSTKIEKWTENNCVPGPAGSMCSNTDHEITQHYAPKRINVRQDEGDFQLQWDVTIEREDSGPGLCELITGLGAGIAGAVSGAAGGAFGIAAIFCDG